jgi:methionyl-tRNA formyltransferase
VKAAALELGVPVTHQVDDILEADVDLGIVVAFGEIIRPHVLARIPMVNIHFSLLPRWRGAAPVERAILAGDEITGVCLMQMEEGLDTGGVYAAAQVEIGADDTAGSLRERLGEVGTELLVAQLAAGEWHATPQEGEPVYAHKLTVDDRRLDWRAPAVEVYRVVRIGDAHTTFRGDRFKVHRASLAEASGRELGPGEIGRESGAIAVGCGTGALHLDEVQASGRARQPADAWANGAQPAPGERLGG